MGRLISIKVVERQHTLRLLGLTLNAIEVVGSADRVSVYGQDINDVGVEGCGGWGWAGCGLISWLDEIRFSVGH